MKRLIHAAVLAAALAFALLLCGCSGAETSHKAPQRAAVESGDGMTGSGAFHNRADNEMGEMSPCLNP